MKDITMNKIIHTFQIILLLGLIAAQPLNAQLRVPASPILKNNGENEGSYQVRFQKIKKCRDRVRQYLSQPANFGSNYNGNAMHNRGPQIPSKQNCANALWYLQRASAFGDFESAQILGDVYSTGRLKGNHVIPPNPAWAAHYRIHAWSIAKNSGVVGWKNRELPLAEQHVAVLAKNGNLLARKSFSDHLVAKGDRLSQLGPNLTDAMDAYSKAASLNPNDVQLRAKMEQILPHAMQLAFGNIRHQIKPWHIAGAQNPRVMHEAAKLARRQGDSLRAINLAEAAHRNLAPNAQAPTEVFIASIRMKLASDAELNRDYPRAIFHAKQAKQFGSIRAEGLIEDIKFNEAGAMVAKGDYLVAKTIYLQLRQSPNAHTRAQAKAMGNKLPDAAPDAGVRVFSLIKDSVFKIQTDSGSGTGFVVADGIIASNVHVIEGATSATAIQISTGKKYAVNLRPYAADYQRDLVLLRVNFNGSSPRPLPLKPIGAVQVGETAYALGNPRGLFGNFSKGSVTSKQKYNSSKLRLSAGKPGDVIIVTDTAINPGNSGGPLVDNKGWVIGVNTYHITKGDLIVDDGLNFAISAEYVKELLR